MSAQVTLLICYGPLPVFFFTVSKLQFRHRVEGLRTHRFWLAFFLACVLHALGTNMGSNPAASARMSSIRCCMAAMALLKLVVNSWEKIRI